MIEFDSASAMVGGTATGRYIVGIEGYSQAKLLLAEDEHMDSQPLSIGGRTWCIWCYLTRDIAFGVALDDSIPEPALAEASYFLLDRAGNEMPGPCHSQGSFYMFKYLFAGDGHGVLFPREFVESPECLADDCFKVRVDIRVFTGSRCENRGTMASAAVPPSDLHRHLGDLLMAGEGADITFQVAGETFRAHRCVLAARSPVFKAKLFGAMGQSAAEVCIRIQDMEPDVFSALLHFMYTDSLQPEMMMGQEEGERVLVLAQHLLEAANRYGMQRLTCEDKLCGCLGTRTAATTLVLADQHQCLKLKKACIEFLRSQQVLNTVMAMDSFELIRSYPNLLKELVSKATAP